MNLSRPDREDRLDRLAAEYALGTLSAHARARLARTARAEPAVATAIRDWELRLAAWAEPLSPVTPSPRVWSRIADHLGLSRDGASTPASWWADLAVWRGLAAAGFAAALALGVALYSQRPAPDAPLVAVLAGPDGRPALIANGRRSDAFLLVKAVGRAPVEPGKSLELWMLPQGQPPRSLGVLPPGDLARVPLPAPSGTALADIPALAVSLEPAGGSPTGLPTGPVLYSGSIERMY